MAALAAGGLAAVARPPHRQPAPAARRGAGRPPGHRESVSARQSCGRGRDGAGRRRDVHRNHLDRAARLAAGHRAHRAARACRTFTCSISPPRTAMRFTICWRSRRGLKGSRKCSGAVSAQMQSIDGRDVQRDRMQGFARRYARSVTVSTAGPKAPLHRGRRRARGGPTGAHPALPEVSVAEPPRRCSISTWDRPSCGPHRSAVSNRAWSRSTKANRCG